MDKYATKAGSFREQVRLFGLSAVIGFGLPLVVALSYGYTELAQWLVATALSLLIAGIVTVLLLRDGDSRE